MQGTQDTPGLAQFLAEVRRVDDSSDLQPLVALAPRLAKTRSTRGHEGKQMCVLVFPMIREIVPLALESVGWPDLADKLRRTSPDTDRSAMISCAQEVQEVARQRNNGGVDGSINRAFVAVAHAELAVTSAAMSAVITTGDMGDGISDAARGAAIAVSNAYAAVQDAATKRRIIEIAVHALEEAIATPA
jgi:hypothetical protein